MSRILRNTDIKAALRSRQRGFLLNPFRFSPTVDYKINMDFEGDDGGSVFTDTGSLGLTWTRSGTNVTTSTAQVLAGTTSLRVNGNSDYLETSGFLLPATGDWELTFKLYQTGGAGRRCFSIADTSSSASGSQWQFYMSQNFGGAGSTAANIIYVFMSNGSSFDVICQTSNIIGQAASQNWKLSRTGNTVAIDIDGITGSGTFSGSINQPSGRKFRVGKTEISGELGPNLLYIDTLRFRLL